MNKTQIYDMIDKNKVNNVLIKDYAGNRLAEICSSTPEHCTKELEEVLENFKDYRKLEICGKKGSADVPWSKGFSWQLDLNTTAVQIGGPPVNNNAGIGAMDLMNMYKGWMDENMKLQRELMQKTLESNNNDPTKWMPVMQFGAQILGLQPAGGIQGPPGRGTAAAEPKELHFADVDPGKKMSAKEIGEKIWEQLSSLQAKISGPQMIKILTRLEQNPNLSAQTEDICFLLESIIKNPSLLPTAVNYIKFTNG